MAEKIHVNTITGEVGICHAQLKCRFGGDTGFENHFNTADEAYAFYEKTQKSKIFNNTQTKNNNTEKNGSQIKDLKKYIKSWKLDISNIKKDLKSINNELYNNSLKLVAINIDTKKDFESTEEVYSKISELNEYALSKKNRVKELEVGIERTNIKIKNLQKVSKENVEKPIKVIKKKSAAYLPPRSDKTHIPYDSIKQYKNIKPATQSTIYIGKLNPTTLEGSSSEYVEKDQSYIILGKSDGTRARVVFSSGDLSDDLDNYLGKPITQEKMRDGGWSNPAKTYDLFVLGCISSDGRKVGWIPDKQISSFVYD